MPLIYTIFLSCETEYVSVVSLFLFLLDSFSSVSTSLYLDYALADSCICRQIDRETYGYKASNEVVKGPRTCCHFLWSNEVVKGPRTCHFLGQMKS